MRKSIAITIGLVIILGSVAAYFFFKKPAAAPQATNPVTGLPFGSGDTLDTDGNPTGQGTKSDTSGAGGTLPKLFQLSATPVAGAASIIKNNTEVVRFADR